MISSCISRRTSWRIICSNFGNGAVLDVTMKLTRYQTDNRIWLWMALSLFLVSWCFPLPDSAPPFVWLWGIIAAAFHSDLSFPAFFGVSAVLIGFACISTLVSMTIAWLIQCVVVIVRSKK